MNRCALLIVCLVSISACRALPTPRVTVHINLVGPDSMQWLAKSLTAEYSIKRPEVAFTIQISNSDNGIRAANEISRTIGMVSRTIKPDELAQTRAVVVATDGVAVVVNRKNPINAIKASQVTQVFSGEILTWPTGPTAGQNIVVVSREDGSGTRDAFQAMAMKGVRVTRAAVVMPSEAAVIEFITKHPEVIGYTSMSALTSDVRALMVGDAALTSENVESLKYPFARTLAFIIPQKPDPDVQAFVDFALSPEGQRIIEQKMGRALPSSP